MLREQRGCLSISDSRLKACELANSCCRPACKPYGLNLCLQELMQPRRWAPQARLLSRSLPLALVAAAAVPSAPLLPSWWHPPLRWLVSLLVAAQPMW